MNKPLGALGVYGNLADPLNVSKTGVYIVECLIADMIMVRRCVLACMHDVDDYALLAGVPAMGDLESQLLCVRYTRLLSHRPAR